MRLLSRIVAGVLALLLLGVVTFAVLVLRSRPVVDGETAIDGLEARVEIVRDVDGVPHITADSTHDLFLAQGYVHAQDRFWQMDFWRHLSGGRLAELFGEGQIEADMFLRTLGFHRIAAEEYASATDELRTALDAYAAGVNAYLAERRGSELSFEYVVLGLQNGGYTPEPWTPIDTLAWSKVMAWDLRASLDEEIDRAVLTRTIPLEQVEKLYPPYPEDHPFIVREDVSNGAADETTALAVPDLEQLLTDITSGIDQVQEVTGGGFDGIGSNNWVVSGERTVTGSPMLANDPHLGIQMPSIWYENHLRCAMVDDTCPYSVTGFSFPGAPGVVIGHNERIAWGVTNQAPDTLDLYVERVDPDNPDRYEADGGFLDMEVHTETIEVAGGDPVELRVRATRHGPVVSGLYGDLDDVGAGGVVEVPETHVISMRWTALEPSGAFDAFLGINRASDWEEFRSALSTFDIAAQNFVYADIDGHIGYQSTGRIPIRTAGNGRYPVPGWTDEHEWSGYIPFDSLPREFDPERGFIATANQPVIPPTDERFLGIDHAYGYRALRIEARLESNPAIDIEAMQSIQLDTRDASAEALVPALLAVESEFPEVLAIQSLLATWSEHEEAFRMDAESPGAAAYAAVWRHVLDLAFDELPEDHPADGNERFFAVVENLLDTPEDLWWDERDTADRVETRDSVLERAMRVAHAELVELLGDDTSGWRWGDMHRATFANQSFGASGIAPIEAIFNRTAPAAVGGGSGIVNATGWAASEGYEVAAVPSMRMVIDLADFSRSESVHTTGQSGHVFSSHYFDQNELWTEGRAHPMRWTEPQIEADAEGTLVLTPLE